MAGSLIRSAILGGATELLQAHGVRPAPVARQAALPVAALTDPDLLVQATAVLRFFDAAAEACHLPTWGLSLARGARLATIIGPLWILLRNARTVGQLCDELADNFDLYTDVAMVSVERLPHGGALLTWTTAAAQHDSDVQMAEFALSVIGRELRSHLSPQWRPAAAMFRHAKPAGSLAVHHATFGDDLRFNQDHNALLLDAATLDAPTTARGSSARALASRVVRLEAGHRDKHVARDVEAVVRSLMPYAPCTIGEVSRALDIASRTLQLRLKEEDTSFMRIRDAVRADLASKYLRYSDLTAAQVAEILGYATPTSFSRSFRRWNGQSLREQRRLTSGH
jgi:AraC-like DNA-binding protein